MYRTALNKLDIDKELKESHIVTARRWVNGDITIVLNDVDMFKDKLGDRELSIDRLLGNADEFIEFRFSINKYGYTFIVKLYTTEDYISYIAGDKQEEI